MARIVWDRRANIQSAASLIPPVVQRSTKDFRPPSTIEDDFRRLLQHDVPHVNYTYELVRDWYDLESEGYKPVYIRGQQAKENKTLKTTHDTLIQKGDMIIREDGNIFLLSADVQNHPNNQAAEIGECNVTLEFTRMFEDETSFEGYLIHQGGRRVVVPQIPAVYADAGAPDYGSASGVPGIAPDFPILVYLQWNPVTKNIFLDDQFVIGAFTYRVINVSVAGVDIDQTHGVLKLNAKRVAGGAVQNENEAV